jgi:hypothetical protein
MNMSTDVAVVVERLDQASVAIGRWLTGGFEEILDMLWKTC